MSRPKGVFAVLVLLCLGAFAFGCGGDDGVTQEDVDAAIQRVENEQAIDEVKDQVRGLEKQANRAKRDAAEAAANLPPEPSTDVTDAAGPVASCADGVRVGPNTTCSFAMNVAGEKGSNPDSTTVSAFSPASGEHYTMTCLPWSGGGTVCTGGNGASVFLP